MLPSYDDLLIKRFEQPDEVRTFEKGKFETVKIGSMTIGGPVMSRDGNGRSMWERRPERRFAKSNMSAWSYPAAPLVECRLAATTRCGREICWNITRSRAAKIHPPK